MTPIVAGTPDSATSLHQLNQAITKLRHVVNQCAIRQAQNAAANRHTSSEAKAELQRLSQQLLAQAVTLKLAHEGVIRDVHDSRSTIRNDQEEQLKARLKLQNLLYEKETLHRDISVCRTVTSPQLAKTAVTIPPELFSAETATDDADAENFQAAKTALQAELAARRQAAKDEEAAKHATQHKRRELTDMRDALRKLPEAVARVATVVKPVRALVTDAAAADGNASAAAHFATSAGAVDMSMLAQLPAPLYVLAREALGLRDAFGLPLRVSVVPDGVRRGRQWRRAGAGAGTGGGGGVSAGDGEEGEREEGEADEEEEEDDDEEMITVEGEDDEVRKLYRAGEWAVVLEVGAEGVSGVLHVRFRFLQELGLVVVRAAVAVDRVKCDEYPLKQLQLLYPRDNGEHSPRACHAHLLGGDMQFDARRAGGRAFVWANVMCGVECVPRLGTGAGSGWVAQMWALMVHMRTREVVEAMQGRLRAVVELKRQVEALVGKELCVTARDIGLGEREPAARVEDFVKLGRGDWAGGAEAEADEGARAGDEDAEGRDVWGLKVVGKEGIRLRCMVAIEADYPLRRPVFRIECEQRLAGVSDADVVEMERGVNELSVSGKYAGRTECVFGAQVTALLVFVDRVERACAAAEGAEEAVVREVAKGRTRSKRDLMRRSDGGTPR